MRTDKSAELAGERTEPMTAAEHAQATGHQGEYARDVPRGCTCIVQWDTMTRRYVRIHQGDGCPWHTVEYLI